MSLIDQYGQPYRYSSKFAHGANNSGNDGPRYRNVLDDIQVLIPQHDRRTLQSLSRRLYTNFGVLKSALDHASDPQTSTERRPLTIGHGTASFPSVTFAGQLSTGSPPFSYGPRASTATAKCSSC
mgnify:CR=1 FL=1